MSYKSVPWIIPTLIYSIYPSPASQTAKFLPFPNSIIPNSSIYGPIFIISIIIHFLRE